MTARINGAASTVSLNSAYCDSTMMDSPTSLVKTTSSSENIVPGAPSISPLAAFSSPPLSLHSPTNDIGPPIEEVLYSLMSASDAVEEVLTMKREEIAKEQIVVSKLRNGIDEPIPDDFLRILASKESKMQEELREALEIMNKFGKEAELPSNLISIRDEISDKRKVLVKMERSIQTILVEQYQLRQFWYNRRFYRKRSEDCARG